jgi:hypothetical protein
MSPVPSASFCEDYASATYMLCKIAQGTQKGSNRRNQAASEPQPMPSTKGHYSLTRLFGVLYSEWVKLSKVAFDGDYVVKRCGRLLQSLPHDLVRSRYIALPLRERRRALLTPIPPIAVERRANRKEFYSLCPFCFQPSSFLPDPTSSPLSAPAHHPTA